MVLRYGINFGTGEYPLPSLYISEVHLLPIIFSKLSKKPSKKKLTQPILVSLKDYVERARLPKDTDLDVLSKAAHQVFAAKIVQNRKAIDLQETSHLFTSFQVCLDTKAVQFLFSQFAQENYDCLRGLFDVELLEESYPFALSPTGHFYWRLRHFHSQDFAKAPDLVLKIKGGLEVFGCYFSSTDFENDLEAMLEQACKEINNAPFSVFDLTCEKEDEESLILKVRLAKEKITWQDLILEESYVGHVGVPRSVVEANFGEKKGTEI